MRARVHVRSAIIVGSVAAVLTAAPADAARAEPTDFETTVVSITPSTDSVGVELVGDTTFVSVTADPGSEVLINGYFGEPYVRIGGDGTVFENRRSPTVVENGSQDDSAVIDATVSADDVPEWVVVASDGRYVWHDHRAHWMNPRTPPEAERGDVLQRGVIELQVDGVPVEVHLATVWRPSPSALPFVVGAAGVVVAVVIARRAGVPTSWVGVFAAGAATVVGWWQFLSLPAATGRSLLPVWLPIVAGATIAVGALLRRSLAASALVLIGGLELGVWVILRLDRLERAVLPTSAPSWLERATIGIAVAGAAAAVIAGTWGLLTAAPSSRRHPEGASTVDSPTTAS
jgi:hypothetical protein